MQLSLPALSAIGVGAIDPPTAPTAYFEVKLFPPRDRDTFTADIRRSHKVCSRLCSTPVRQAGFKSGFAASGFDRKNSAISIRLFCLPETASS